MSQHFDLFVIGGGPAGHKAMSVALDAGLKVGLAERSHMGGTCLNYGCDPCSCLDRAGEVAHLVRQAHAFGIPAELGAVRLASVMDRIDQVLDRLRGGVGPQESFKKLEDEHENLTVFHSDCHFTAPGHLQLGRDGEEVTADTIVVAVGSGCIVPSIRGLLESNVRTHVSMLDLRTLPQSFAVVGAGSVGLEVAQAFSRLGSRVTVIDTADRIATLEEPEISEALLLALQEEGIHFELETEVSSFVERDGQKVLLLHSLKDGSGHALMCDEVLVAAGREPATGALEAEAGGLRLAEDGAIEIDECLRAAEGVYAVGDCTSVGFTHRSSHEAEWAVRHALGEVQGTYLRPPAIWCSVHQPEVGHLGLTEAQAREAHPDAEIHTHLFPLDALPRHVHNEEAVGLLKYVIDGATGKLLGAHLLGACAGETIAALAVMMRGGMNMAELAEVVLPYPTRSEAIVFAARRYLKQQQEAANSAAG